MTDEPAVFTIGHSTHSTERFVALLLGAGVTAIADVRSSPFSRRHPQFNRDALRDELRLSGISYAFLGKELGGRPSDPAFYCEGVADYEKMAQAPDFRTGLDRVVEGARTHRVALMCSERDPMDCHRCLLVSRALVQRGVNMKHLLGDGGSIDQSAIEDRLLKLSSRRGEDLFAPQSERLAMAYREHARKAAFAKPRPMTDPIK
jgi:uncharacterized protein (DUF488 family)